MHTQKHKTFWWTQVNTNIFLVNTWFTEKLLVGTLTECLFPRCLPRRATHLKVDWGQPGEDFLLLGRKALSLLDLSRAWPSSQFCCEGRAILCCTTQISAVRIRQAHLYTHSQIYTCALTDTHARVHTHTYATILHIDKTGLESGFRLNFSPNFMVHVNSKS